MSRQLFLIDALGIHLGLSWHSVLRWGADVRAFTLSGEADCCGQGVLHLYGGRGRLTDGGHQLYGGQDSWRRGLEVNEVEHILTGRVITKRHLNRKVKG